MFKKFTVLAVVGTGLIGTWAAAQDYTTMSLGSLISDETLSLHVADYSLVDASQFTSTTVDGLSGSAVKVKGENSDLGVANAIWQGGLIIGSIPTDWDWRTAHDNGGTGVRIENSGPIEYRFVRVHNVEDGLKTREVPEYSNTASWSVRDSYVTAIRDDAVENDRFEPGSVSNSLFDGVHTFYSEQNENVDSNTAIGPEEKDTVEVDGVLVRIYPTNNEIGGGKWFKIQGRGVPNHRVLVSNSVFAVGAMPSGGWGKLDFDPVIEWVGSNNYILWLGEPGTYEGPRPSQVTFLEGTAAEEKWVSMRNDWLVRHGLAAQDLPADYNPHTAPLEQIPLVSNPIPQATGEPAPAEPTTTATNATTTTTGTATLIVPAVEDTYVASGSSSPMGTASILEADMSPLTEAYVKFDISGISGVVTSAKLRIYVTNATSNAPTVQLVDNYWNELTLIYAERPAVIDNSVADLGSVRKGQYVDYDVTSMVEADGTLSFGFFPDSSNGMDFYSKEATSASPPQLIIEFAN